LRDFDEAVVLEFYQYPAKGVAGVPQGFGLAVSEDQFAVVSLLEFFRASASNFFVLAFAEEVIERPP